MFIGASLCGFDRIKALSGDKTATQLCQMTRSSESSFLPGDMDGPTPPADGTPGLFITWQNNNPGQLLLRKLTLNFSAGTSALSSKNTISVANDTLACLSCVPQLGTNRTLATIDDRLMYRFAIRHFADHDRAVFNHAVANGSRVAFRWYEIYDPAGTVTLHQQGTYAPDSTYRWMGSMAEDQNADIGVGYSASSGSVHPAIRFTGRVPSDSAGTLESEASMVEGAGSQTGGPSRWGDYTALQVDPSDDCTFWYVDQYEQTSGSFNWATNISSFKFNGCGGSGSPGATLSTTKLSIGKVVIGQTSAAKSVTLTNNGSATLNISSIVASGDYAISSSTCGSQLNAGSSCKVSVTFTPAAAGIRKGTLSFTNNAPGSPQTVALTGIGTSLSLNPTSLAFGGVPVGKTSPSQTITITNATNVSVTINGIALGGTNASDYVITKNTCSSSLAGGAKCGVSIAFKPLITGNLPARLAISQDGGGGTLTAKLTGRGL